MWNKKAVVFDMDGVLFDTERLCMESWDMIAGEHGICDMETIFMQCVGRNANDTKTLILNHYGQDFPYDDFCIETSKWFRQQIERNGMPIKTGVRELLDYLREEDYQIGLASSTKKASVISHLTDAGIRDYFSVIIGGDMVEHSKPRPDIYLLACEQMQVSPEETYAVEDSPNGIRSAHAAGMQPIMVPDLIAPDEEMERLSSHIFKDLLEVKKFLRKQ